MKAQPVLEPAMPTPFERFKTAMKAILSVPKEAVTQEEKRQQVEREAARTAHRSRRSI